VFTIDCSHPKRGRLTVIEFCAVDFEITGVHISDILDFDNSKGETLFKM
jgi:hypothetical protein